MTFILSSIIYCVSAAMYFGVLLPIYRDSITRAMVTAAVIYAILIGVMCILMVAGIWRKATPRGRKYITQVQAVFLGCLLKNDLLANILLDQTLETPDVAVCSVFVFTLVTFSLGLLLQIARCIWLFGQRGAKLGWMCFLPNTPLRIRYVRRNLENTSDSSDDEGEIEEIEMQDLARDHRENEYSDDSDELPRRATRHRTNVVLNRNRNDQDTRVTYRLRNEEENAHIELERLRFLRQVEFPMFAAFRYWD